MGEGRWRDPDREAEAKARRWRIVLAREAASRGLMVEALAERSGLPGPRIADWLAGRNELTVIDAEVLLLAMGLPLDEFLKMVANLDPDDLHHPAVAPWIIRALPGRGE